SDSKGAGCHAREVKSPAFCAPSAPIARLARSSAPRHSVLQAWVPRIIPDNQPVVMVRSARLEAARTGKTTIEEAPIMDPVRRNILATGAAAATLAAAPQVFAQQAGQGGTDKFYEKGPVRIRYNEAGSGFPLLLIAGGGLNSV